MIVPTESECHDEFTEAMWEHVQLVNKKCTEQIRDLRKRNAILVQRDHAHAADMWELAEKIQMLESLVDEMAKNPRRIFVA